MIKKNKNTQAATQVSSREMPASIKCYPIISLKTHNYNKQIDSALIDKMTQASLLNLSSEWGKQINEICLLPALVNIFTTTESILEQKLMACLIIVPDEVLKAVGDFRPEVNNSVKYFWGLVQGYKNLILESLPDEQVEICFKLIYERDRKIYWEW